MRPSRAKIAPLSCEAREDAMSDWEGCPFDDHQGEFAETTEDSRECVGEQAGSGTCVVSDGCPCARRGDHGARDLSPRELGMRGEELASSYLESRGLEIVERNFRCRSGEADIVAREDGEYILVEVKTRLAIGRERESLPELAVDSDKRERYRRIALEYMMLHPEVSFVRFDVIAINVVGERQASLRHLVGAFSWDE